MSISDVLLFKKDENRGTFQDFYNMDKICISVCPEPIARISNFYYY